MGDKSAPVCTECGLQTDDVWHSCLPCRRCEHDRPYHDLPDREDPCCRCDCPGYLGMAA